MEMLCWELTEPINALAYIFQLDFYFRKQKKKTYNEMFGIVIISSRGVKRNEDL